MSQILRNAIFQLILNQRDVLQRELLYLLASLMFLVYDGGHSMQEVLYVANQLNDTLKLGLDLAASNENEAPEAEEFVADYSKFAKNLPNEARTTMNDAMDDLVDYFHKNSYYSSKVSGQSPRKLGD